MIEQKQTFKHRNKLSDEVVSIICYVPKIQQLKIPINVHY